MQKFPNFLRTHYEILSIELNVKQFYRYFCFFISCRTSLKNYGFENGILSLPLYGIEDIRKYCEEE